MIRRLIWRSVRTIWKLLPRTIQESLQPQGAKRSYALEGEDRVVFSLLKYSGKNMDKGFYVDIGAHHPWLYSNTNLFYAHGWEGINMDAMPGSMEPFRKLRPKDINLELAVGPNQELLTYYEFEDPAFNGFSEEHARRIQESVLAQLVRTHEIKTLPLSMVLAKYLPEKQDIDFMSVDVEGFDEAVLRSNDWERFRPHFLIVEILDCDTIGDVTEHSTSVYLYSIGYQTVARTGRSVIFEDAKWEKNRN